ncbi:ubiquitin carboxyl-terminal hydrolase [Rhypophila decipiens]|uniref:ubiquitinyl hydrolase 1 n=1 Tax=Rhypophila decipiens TaxID=261697 RepID=A0AAN6YDM4_9PEZI|nr:ubiquitin carboxyl-terminal hydrolase [Rhypophila decipiens]
MVSETDKRTFLERKFKGFFRLVKAIDEKVNTSTFGRVFRLRGSGHPEEIADANFSTEIRAGLTTFATMGYIVAASILADTGFGCLCVRPLDSLGNCQNNDEWKRCYNGAVYPTSYCAEFLPCPISEANSCPEVKLDLITATAAIAGMASILFGFLTNLPVCLAPGMGLNAYFTYQVVGIKGSGSVSYKVALTAIFIEGWIFMFLALTGLRHWLVKIIPGTIKTASGVGIGLFLTLIGMSYSSGIGIVTGAISTPLAIGGCPAEHLSANGECGTDVMSSPKTWLGITCGGLFVAFLMAFRVKFAIVIGIAIVSFLSWPRNTAITYFPDTIEGTERWNFFKKVVAFHPIKHTMLQQEWDLSGAVGPEFALALFTFLYVDIIDCTATLYSMARFCGKVRKSDGDFPRSTLAYCTDALCISVGSLFGCSPVTAFIESGAGITEGGRTGLTAISAGCFFLGSLFFAPIFASVPPWATGCTLIMVGCLMIRQVTKVNWAYIGDAIPSFVTLTFIPFSYSVAYGLIAGLFTYTVLNTMIWIVIKVSGEAILPMEYDQKEYWTWMPVGKKPWIFRIFSTNRFWTGQGDTDSVKEGNRESTGEFALTEIREGETTSAGSSIHQEPSAQNSLQTRTRSRGQLDHDVGHSFVPRLTTRPFQGVFTYLLDNLGVKDVQFEELLSLDADALAQLHPVYGVIFLFKFPTDTPYRTNDDKPLDGTFDHEAAESSLWFAAQTIQNACGTQALLSVLLNKAENESGAEEGGYIDVGPTLRDFREFTMVLPPEFRGEALSNAELIRDVHNSFSKSSPFVDETQRNPDDPTEDAFHFIAYTPINGTLYELDGLQPAPISHGSCSQQEFPQKVMDVLMRRIARYDATEIRFNLLAMVRDLRIRARELGDVELLEREERKRHDWRFENALRRHNFLGFQGEVLKGVVAAKLKDGSYEQWIEAGKDKMKKRIEERRKEMGGGGGAKGGEDVVMEG